MISMSIFLAMFLHIQYENSAWKKWGRPEQVHSYDVSYDVKYNDSVIEVSWYRISNSIWYWYNIFPKFRLWWIMSLHYNWERYITLSQGRPQFSLGRPWPTLPKPKTATVSDLAGASIHMGRGTRPPNIWTGGNIITNVALNISGVISATFYPCNIFLISWKSSQSFLWIFFFNRM